MGYVYGDCKSPVILVRDYKSGLTDVNPTEEIIKKISNGLDVEFKIIPATNDKKEKAIQLRTK